MMTRLYGSVRLLVLLLAGMTSAVAAPGDNLDRALLVEWMMANCDQSSIPALTVGAANMVINGSDPTIVAQRREYVREGMKKNSPSIADACASLFKGMH